MRDKKLTREDRCALDLLLDGEVSNLSDSGVFVKSVDVEPQRVQTVKQVLSLLNQLPAADPPRDLMGRTLHKIDRLAREDGSSILRPTSVQRPSDERPQA